MKTRFWKPVRFLCVVLLCVMAGAPRAPAQTRPRLGLKYSAGQPALTLTGTVGTVYSIQYTPSLSATSLWTDRTLIQVQGANTIWSDPSAPAPSRRFYRAVSVPAPSDTNLVFIQPGTFIMGSPSNEAERCPDEAQHVVTISRGFWMEKYLVTQGDYLAVVGSNPSYFQPPNVSLDLARPVEEVSWSDATNYCSLRTAHERAAGLIPTNYVYRLPTESEWEYAARAGTTTAFYLGSSLHSGQANFNGTNEYDASLGDISNPSGIYLQMTTPVGSYAANGWGLYDIVGNVWELCQDWYDIYQAGSVTDPQGPVTGTYRVIRGGSWYIYARYCRSAQRGTDFPTDTNYLIGFRVVLAQDQL